MSATGAPAGATSNGDRKEGATGTTWLRSELLTMKRQTAFVMFQTCCHRGSTACIE